MTVIIKEDGIMSEVVETESIEIVDGVLHTDYRKIQITDRFCMLVEDAD